METPNTQPESKTLEPEVRKVNPKKAGPRNWDDKEEMQVQGAH